MELDGKEVGIYHYSYGDKYYIKRLATKGKTKGKLVDFDDYCYDSVKECENELKSQGYK